MELFFNILTFLSYRYDVDEFRLKLILGILKNKAPETINSLERNSDEIH